MKIRVIVRLTEIVIIAIVAATTTMLISLHVSCHFNRSTCTWYPAGKEGMDPNSSSYLGFRVCSRTTGPN